MPVKTGNELMSKKKARKTRQAARPVEIAVGPEIRSMMRKFGLTEEEALRMMRECDATLYGANSGHVQPGS
ncbi:hypothetical protein X729_18720 [Mesorhizobium sp. L103C131B0]|nr:hypothetical protein X729_18720 [Mesorhizobium sp. L103C131B0]